MSVPGLSGLAMSVNLSPMSVDLGLTGVNVRINLTLDWREEAGTGRRERGESWSSIYIKLKVGFSLRHM